MAPPSLSQVFQEDPDLVYEATHQPLTFKFPVAPKLLVASDHYPPHVFVTEHPNGTWSQEGGLLKLFSMLAESINFTYELTRPPDGSWGQLHSDGQWTGMIGMIVRKEVDMALGPFASTYNRAQAVSLTPSIVVDPLTVAVGRQVPEANPWGFMLTFGSYTWLGIFLSMVAVSVMLLVMSSGNKKDKRNIFIRATDIFYDIVKSVLQQDIRIVTRRYPIQLLVGFFLFFVLVMMRTFSSALVSMLAVRNIPVLFRDLQDIVDNKEIKVILEENSAVTEMFQNEKTGFVGKVGKFYDEGRILEMPLPEFYDAMVNNVAGKKDTIMVGEKLLLGTFMAQSFKELGYCLVYLLPEFFTEYRIAMALAKNTPLIHPFTARILHYQTMGFYKNWINDELMNASLCYSPPGKVSFTEPYGITNLWGILLMCAVGLLFATLVFSLECLLPDVRALQPSKWRGVNVLEDTEELNPQTDMTTK